MEPMEPKEPKFGLVTANPEDAQKLLSSGLKSFPMPIDDPAVVSQIVGTFIRTSFIQGFNSASVSRGIQRGFNFAVEHRTTSMNPSLISMWKKLSELTSIAALQNARAISMLTVYLDMNTARLSQAEIQENISQCMANFHKGRTVKEEDLAALTEAMSELATACLGVGPSAKALQHAQDDLEKALDALEEAEVQRHNAEGNLRALKQQLEFLQQPGLSEEVYKGRITILTGVRDENHRLLATIPVFDTTTTTRRRGGWFRRGRTTTVTTNNVQKRQVYQATIDRIDAEIDALTAHAKADAEQRQNRIVNLQREIGEATALSAKALTAETEKRKKYEDQRAVFDRLIEGAETLNKDTLRSIEALAQALNDSLQPVQQFAAALVAQAETIELKATNNNNLLFFQTMVRHAMFAYGYQGMSPLLLSDVRLAEGLARLLPIRGDMRRTYGATPLPPALEEAVARAQEQREAAPDF